MDFSGPNSLSHAKAGPSNKNPVSQEMKEMKTAKSRPLVKAIQTSKSQLNSGGKSYDELMRLYEVFKNDRIPLPLSPSVKSPSSIAPLLDDSQKPRREVSKLYMVFKSETGHLYESLKNSLPSTPLETPVATSFAEMKDVTLVIFREPSFGLWERVHP